MKQNKSKSFFHMSVRPWGLLTAAGTVACIATVFGFFGRFSWFLDLFSHFRVQYFIGLCILGLILLAFKHLQAGSVFLIFAFINFSTILPLYLKGNAPSAYDGKTLRAILLNVNTQLGDAERIRKFIQENSPDFVILEEISARWVKDLQWLAISHQYSCIQPRDDNFGIGLFSKFPFIDASIVHIGDAKLPSVIAIIDTDNGSFAILATHPLPPGNANYSKLRNSQLEKIPDHIPRSFPVLLLGDLNVTPWNHYFRRLLKRTGLEDSSQGRGVQPTWPNFNPLLRIPLDHCLYSSEILLLSKKIGPDVGSDHYPVIVDFVMKPKENGTALLSEQNDSAIYMRCMTKRELIERLLISVAVIALIGFWAINWTIKSRLKRSRKITDFASKFYNTMLFTLSDMGIVPCGENGRSVVFWTFSITSGFFCSEEKLFDEMKEFISKQSVDIIIDGVKTSLPFSAILGKMDYKGDVELETRKATMEYVATLRHENPDDMLPGSAGYNKGNL